MMYRTVTVEAKLADSIIEVTPVLSGDISVNAEIVNQMAGREIPSYDGEYVITPLARDEQVLATRNKRMLDDVTVHRVPYFETTNESGTTIYIAEA